METAPTLLATVPGTVIPLPVGVGVGVGVLVGAGVGVVVGAGVGVDPLPPQFRVPFTK